MRRLTRFAAIAVLFTLPVALVACSGGATSATPTSDESAVPEGMPVMYEFYTLS